MISGASRIFLWKRSNKVMLQKIVGILICRTSRFVSMREKPKQYSVHSSNYDVIRLY